MADEKGSKWQCYIIPDLATWTGAAGSKPYTPIEFYDTYEQAAARFRELRSEPYNSEDLPGARLTFGIQREEPPSAADLGFDRVRAYEPGAMEPKDVTFSGWKHPLKPMLRKSVLKELKESRPKEVAAKPPRKPKERGRE